MVAGDTSSAAERDSRDERRVATSAEPAVLSAQAAPAGLGPRSHAAVRWALTLIRLGPVLILIGVCVVISLLTPVFLTVDNLGNVLSQTAVIATLALGQLLVILTRGIDLSVGSTLAVSSVAGALTYSGAGTWYLPVLAMLGTGLLVGTINGTFYVYGRLPHPFIITLATLSIASGVALGLSGGQPIQGMPQLVQTVGGNRIGSIPYSAFLVAAMAILVTVLLVRVVWGRWIYAVGGDPEAARRTGIPYKAVLISVYMFSGLLAGVGAFITSGQLDAGSPTFGNLAELDSIAAVVIGGASFLGGRGNVGNALVGALMIGVIRNGMNLLNVESYEQLIVIGAVIVVAVESDVVRTQLEKKFRVLSAATQ